MSVPAKAQIAFLNTRTVDLSPGVITLQQPGSHEWSCEAFNKSDLFLLLLRKGIYTLKGQWGKSLESHIDENFCMPKKVKVPFVFGGGQKEEVVGLSKAGQSRTL